MRSSRSRRARWAAIANPPYSTREPGSIRSATFSRAVRPPAAWRRSTASGRAASSVSARRSRTSLRSWRSAVAASSLVAGSLDTGGAYARMPALILLRHAQASYGAADYDVLSDTGAVQARTARDALAARGLTPERIVVGTLRRQRDTALPWTEAGVRLDEDPRWNEYDAADVLRAHGPGEGASLETPGVEARDFQAVLDEALLAWIAAGADSAADEAWPALPARLAAAPDEAGGGRQGGRRAVARLRRPGGGRARRGGGRPRLGGAGARDLPRRRHRRVLRAASRLPRLGVRRAQPRRGQRRGHEGRARAPRDV